MTTTACRGLTLWSDMLRPPVRRPALSLSHAAMANPFEVFWRMSAAGWMPKARSWPLADWMPADAQALHWTPYAAAWSRAPYASWTPLGDWASWGRVYWPAWTVQPASAGVFAAPAAMSQRAIRYASPSTYASYRTAGGHAVAQIIAPVSNPVTAGLTATAVATQMQTLFGFWRTALGA
jgi:hypothetical protein